MKATSLSMVMLTLWFLYRLVKKRVSVPPTGDRKGDALG